MNGSYKYQVDTYQQQHKYYLMINRYQRSQCIKPKSSFCCVLQSATYHKRSDLNFNFNESLNEFK